MFLIVNAYWFILKRPLPLASLGGRGCGLGDGWGGDGAYSEAPRPPERNQAVGDRNGGGEEGGGGRRGGVHGQWEAEAAEVWRGLNLNYITYDITEQNK